MKYAFLTCLLGLSSSLFAAQEKFKVVTLEAGATAPAFTLPGTDGKDYSLSDYADAPYVVLAFTCNHCPDAISARSRINTFAKNYAGKGVQVIAISSASMKGVRTDEFRFSVYSDSFEDMKHVVKDFKLTHPYLYDGETQAISKAYGAVATPHCYILGPANDKGERSILYEGQFDNGRRKFGESGPDFDNVVIDNMDLLLAGKEITKKKARVYGCSTKWAWKEDLVAKSDADWKALPVTLDTLDDATAKKIAANKTDRVRVINLWSTTCVPCLAEFPDLAHTYKMYSMRPFDLITISVDPIADKAKALDVLKEHHLPTAPHTAKALKANKKENRTTNNYIYHSEDLDPLADTLHPDWSGALPLTIIIEPGGKISYSHEGQIDPIELRKAIIKSLQASDQGKH